MNPYYLACFLAGLMVGAPIGALILAFFVAARRKQADNGNSDDAQGPRPRYQPKEMR
jgi:hypothetical protein